ncbi:MAG: glycosyltransferase family 2 protein, partial [Kamptonema sp. SIO4C4]|nr:glycosyltransferase family 2 protein [Kamptonema sp. SIO4C4]
LCSAQALQVDENERPLYVTYSMGQGLVCYIPQEDIHRGMLLEEVPFGTPAQVAFERQAFLKSGGWDSSLDANFDDIDSWIKIAQFGDALFINRCLAYRTIWPGGYNQRFSLYTRLKTHILIKRKIYELVHPQHLNTIPPVQHIENYLKLHWSMIALKQGQLRDAAHLASYAPLSLPAWQLFLRRLQREQSFNHILPQVYLSYLIHNFRNQENTNLSLIQHYGSWRWGLRAWAEGHPLQALNLSRKALFSPTAWRLLFALFLPQSNDPHRVLLHPNHITLLKIFFFLQKKAPQPLTHVQELHLYLKFRLVGLAFRQKKWFYFLQYFLPLTVSIAAWRLLVKLWFWQDHHRQVSSIRKIILVEAHPTETLLR